MDGVTVVSVIGNGDGVLGEVDGGRAKGSLLGRGSEGSRR